MLLQIAEPGQDAAKAACKKRVVGIDLGTTNSLVAHVADATPAVIHDASGDGLLPSVVAYHGGEVRVGRGAVLSAVDDPADTIASVKRLMGRALADVGALRTPNQLIDDAGRMVKVRLSDGREVSPVQVSAEILK